MCSSNAPLIEYGTEKGAAPVTGSEPLYFTVTDVVFRRGSPGSEYYTHEIATPVRQGAIRTPLNTLL
jgi:hypothetical protein